MTKETWLLTTQQPLSLSLPKIRSESMDKEIESSNEDLIERFCVESQCQTKKIAIKKAVFHQPRTTKGAT